MGPPSEGKRCFKLRCLPVPPHQQLKAPGEAPQEVCCAGMPATQGSAELRCHNQHVLNFHMEEKNILRTIRSTFLRKMS